MDGKKKCKILKSIRQQIAVNNDIEYVVEECPYQGECKGTCPKCEEEVRYLEREIERRRKAGKIIAVAGVATTLVVGAVSCSSVKETVKNKLDDMIYGEQQGAVLAIDPADE